MIGPDIHAGGHPWHGLCTGSVLTLPNADTMAYPQPTGGSCFALTVPGYTAPTRSVAQQDDDTAQGFEWLDHVLVSGDSEHADGLQVYGKRLGQMAWVWALSSSSKWLVDASGLSVTGGLIAGDLVFTEFGLHYPDARAAQTETQTVSETAGTDAATRLRILALSESGDAAVVALTAFDEGSYGNGLMKPLPAACIEIALTETGGVPAGAFSVLYDDADVASDARPVVYGIDGADRPWLRLSSSQTSISATSKKLTIDFEHHSAGPTTVPVTLDINSSYTFTSSTAPSTVDYVPCTTDTLRLAGSDVPNCGLHVTPVAYDFTQNITTREDALASAAASLASRQAEVAANAVTDVYKTCPTGDPTTLLLTDAWVIESAATVNHSWRITEEVITATVGPDTVKLLRVYLLETKSTYSINYEQDGECVASVTHTGTAETTLISYDTSPYLRRTTTPASGSMLYEFWGIHPSCSTEKQYLDAPDISTVGGSTIYQYDVTATFRMVIDSVTTVLGVHEFVVAALTQGNMGMSLYARPINDPDLINADRIEIGWLHVYPESPYLYYETAGAEVIITHPCAGLIGISVKNIVDPGLTGTYYLYKHLRIDGSTETWDGWVETDPQALFTTMHPVTLDIQQDDQLPVCYV